MTIEIKTLSLEPRRQTYSHIARRFGSDRPASRYEEGVLDVQATDHFHYRPLWAPEYEIFDARRTAIEMADWYELRDPRQLYYATYCIARSGLNQVTEQNFAFIEKRDMLASIDSTWLSTAQEYLVPLRHYEWGANMNSSLIADWGYGTALTAAAIFSAGDRLGMAQILGRVGLAIDGNSGTSLDQAKEAWLTGAQWQKLRQLVEDSFVVQDWFETFVAQNLAMDGIVHPLVFGVFDRTGQAHGGAALSMVCEFMPTWYADQSRWVDAVIKRAAAESADNKSALESWLQTWSERAIEAAQPLARHVLGQAGDDAVFGLRADLNARAQKLGLDIGS